MERRSLPPSARGITQLNRAMRAVIVVVLAFGLWLPNASVVINAVLALTVTVLPAVLRRDYHIELPPWHAFFLSGAVLLHSVGMLGPYESVWWWDHLTHTLSATVVASVGFTTVRVLDLHSDAIYLPPRFLALFVLLVTLALGVFWEVLEFGARGLADAVGVGPVLFQYGLEDTVVDLLFDLLGALVVALFGTEALSGLVDQLVDRLQGSAG